MTDTLLRCLVLIEFVTLLACGAGWHLAYRGDLPKPLWRLGWAYGAVLAVVAVAIAANLATQEPVTIGLRLVAVVLAVPALVIAALTVHQVVVEQRLRTEA